MEHTGCSLQSDFYDYYDAALCSTPHSQYVSLRRYRNAPLPMHTQQRILSLAGLPTPTCGPITEMIAHIRSQAGEISSLPGWSELQEVVVFNKLAAAEKVTLDTANILAQGAPEDIPFAMEYIPTSPSHHARILRYVQIGTRHCWVLCRSDDWRIGKGKTTYSPITHMSLSSLSVQAQAAINQPLYSIDFVVLKETVIALNVCLAPHLELMGIERIIEPDTVAASIMARINLQTHHDAQD